MHGVDPIPDGDEVAIIIVNNLISVRAPVSGVSARDQCRRSCRTIRETVHTLASFHERGIEPSRRPISAAELRLTNPDPYNYYCSRLHKSYLEQLIALGLGQPTMQKLDPNTFLSSGNMVRPSTLGRPRGLWSFFEDESYCAAHMAPGTVLELMPEE
jgi:hypothetical protein